MFDVFCWCLKWCLMMFGDVWWCLMMFGDVLRMLNVLVLKFYSSCCLIVAFQSSTSIANIPSTVVAVALFPSPKKDWWWWWWWWWWQWCFWGDWCSQPPSTTARWPKDGLHGIFRAMGVSPSTGAEAATPPEASQPANGQNRSGERRGAGDVQNVAWRISEKSRISARLVDLGPH